MKIWHKIVFVTSAVAVLVCSLCFSTFAYVADYGDRHIKDAYYYTEPFNIGVRTKDSQWISFSNTPYIDNDPSGDNEFFYEFGYEGNLWNVTTFDDSLGYIDGFRTHRIYIEPDVKNEVDGGYNDRIVGNYFNFSKGSVKGNNNPFAVYVVTYQNYNERFPPKLTLQYSSVFYGADGQRYSSSATKDIEPIITDVGENGLYTSYFSVTIGDFSDYVADPTDSGATCPVLMYSDVQITVLQTSIIKSADIYSFSGNDIGIEVSDLLPFEQKVDLVNQDMLGWLATSIDSLMGATLIPGANGLPDLTLGSVFGVVIAIPLVVAFLKLFAGG